MALFHPKCKEHHAAPSDDCEICRCIVAHKKKLKFLAQARKTPFIVHGVDLQAQLRLMLKLPCLDRPKLPTLSVHWGTTGSHGNASIWRNRIRLHVAADTSLASTLELLLHELVHMSLPQGEGHSERFILRTVRAAKEMWGVEIDKPLDTPSGAWKVKAYAVDDRLRDALHEKLRTGALLIPNVPYTFPPKPIDLAARRQQVVEKRAERARKMLAKNEAKLKRTQKLVSKWRVTVRYYERAAAKRGGA